MWEFVTAHVHRQLKAVGVQIAEIIHTCQKKKTTTQKHVCGPAAAEVVASSGLLAGERGVN